MSNTTMKQTAFVLILLLGVAITAIDFFWKSPATIAVSELQVLLHNKDAAAMEAGLVERFQASPERAQRIRQWVQTQQPIRGLALKKNGDGFSIAPDQASHYLVIKGQKSIGHLAVNIVTEQTPRSALKIVYDDMTNVPATVLAPRSP